MARQPSANSNCSQTAITPRPPARRQAHQHTRTHPVAIRRSTRVFFPGKSAGKLSGRAWESLGVWKGRTLTWAGAWRAMGGAGAPGLPFTLPSGVRKARLVPAGPGLEAQRCSRRRRVSHASSPLFSRARETLLGCQASPGQPPGAPGGLRAGFAAFSPLPASSSEVDALLLRQRGGQAQHLCPAASSPLPPPPPARGPQPGSAPPAGRAPPPPLSPRLLFLLPFLLQGCSSRPLQLTEVPGAERPLFPPGRGKTPRQPQPQPRSGPPGAENKTAAAARGEEGGKPPPDAKESKMLALCLLQRGRDLLNARGLKCTLRIKMK